MCILVAAVYHMCNLRSFHYRKIHNNHKVEPTGGKTTDTITKSYTMKPKTRNIKNKALEDMV